MTAGGVGGLALLGLALAMVLSRRGRGKPVPAEAWGGPTWVWPVPSWRAPDGTIYEATVSSGFGSPRRVGTEREHAHNGLDIMYRRRSKGDRPEYPAGKRGTDGFSNGSAMHFAPPGTPVVAVRPGKVWSVKDRSDGGGISVVIDHGKPFATYYTHLQSAQVEPGQTVAMGQYLGIMGGDRSEGAKLRHLHFEIWYEGTSRDASVDAWGDDVMQHWPRTEWS